jgi:hypothetical protein
MKLRWALLTGAPFCVVFRPEDANIIANRKILDIIFRLLKETREVSVILPSAKSPKNSEKEKEKDSPERVAEEVCFLKAIPDCFVSRYRLSHTPLRRAVSDTSRTRPSSLTTNIFADQKSTVLSNIQKSIVFATALAISAETQTISVKNGFSVQKKLNKLHWLFTISCSQLIGPPHPLEHSSF